MKYENMRILKYHRPDCPIYSGGRAHQVMKNPNRPEFYVYIYTLQLPYHEITLIPKFAVFLIF